MEIELEFELDHFVDEEHREFGATLFVDVVIERFTERSVFGGIPQDHLYYDIKEIKGTLVTYDQDGGESRSFEVDDVTEYITDTELYEEIENENI